MLAQYPSYLISIHALREEGDKTDKDMYSFPFVFYPRPPGGGRLFFFCLFPFQFKFLSTPSARWATTLRMSDAVAIGISIHALREEGDAGSPGSFHGGQISIHALREEGDISLSKSNIWSDISIHALREEGDDPAVSLFPDRIRFLSTPSARRATGTFHGASRNTPYFYPRPPRGGRPPRGISCNRRCRFLSTPSARRATSRFLRTRQCAGISIHALREEGDLTRYTWPCWRPYFYPRPPRGGRRSLMVTMPFLMRFLSTPSARRATLRHDLFPANKGYFYPRPPRGGRPKQ